jgi:hypothetical protein
MKSQHVLIILLAASDLADIDIKNNHDKGYQSISGYKYNSLWKRKSRRQPY